MHDEKFQGGNMNRTKSLRMIVTAAVVCISLMAGVSAYAQNTEITVIFHKDKDASDCDDV